MRKALATDFVHMLFWPSELADRKPLCWTNKYWFGLHSWSIPKPVALHRPRPKKANRLRFYRRPRIDEARRRARFGDDLPF